MTALHGANVATSYDAWVAALRDAGGLQMLSTELVDLALARGRVTGEAVVAARSAPAFDAAAMDGIAVVASTTTAAPATLSDDAYRAIDTGDPLPAGMDAVVRREDVTVTRGSVTLARAVEPYTNVRQVGEDVAAGELLLPAGRRLRPADLAVIASVGETAIAVRRRPVVAILPSGDELVPLGFDPGPGEVVETNSLMLAAMVEGAGGVAVRLPIVPDDPDVLAGTLERAAADADLVLLVAGSAKGRGDHAVSVIDRIGRVVVQGVAIRPGHPVVLGLTGSTPVIGVPGYPVSAALAFELFGVRLLGELAAPGVGRRIVQAVIGVDIPSHAASEEWIRVRVGRIGARLVAVPTRRGAGMLSSLARADGLVRIAVGADHAAAGEEVDVELFASPAELERTLLATGSTEPLLDALAGRHPLVADADGSANGAASLTSGRCHLALLEVEDVPPASVVIGVWERPIGLIVAPGNPLAIDGPAGMFEGTTRLVNRQRGSSSRRFLDVLLAEHALDPACVRGYAREARSHAAAAAAVASGLADYAVGVRSACIRHGLGFVPLETRPIALVAGADDDRLEGIRSLLASDAWRATIEELGYAALPRS